MFIKIVFRPIEPRGSTVLNCLSQQLGHGDGFA
jgi:hypothetical protein